MAAPPARTHPTIEVRQSWDHPWTVDTQLRVDGPVQATIGGLAEGSVKLLRTYGPQVKYRGEAAWTTNSAPRSYMDYWVRLLEPTSETVLWQGIIKLDKRQVFRSTGVQRGVQTLTAWGPKEILRRCEISTAIFYTSAGYLMTLGWIPPMNYRGERGELESNKAINAATVHNLYGDGGDLWTHYEYIEYILAEHVQQYVGGGQKDGPWWSVSRPVGFDDLKSMLRFSGSVSALSIIRQLVRPADGFDFAVVPTANGYEVKIFSLLKDTATFGTATIVGNPTQFLVNPTTDAGVVECQAELSGRERVDQLEAIGERIESCFTIPAAYKQDLWTPDMETAYKAGTGTPGDDDVKHDGARKDDRFRLVYQGHAADSDFDLQSGQACPQLDAQGDWTGSTDAHHQTEIRESLPELPLKEGVDYSSVFPNLADAQEDYVPPLALAYVSADVGYVPVDALSAPNLEDEGLAVHAMSVRYLKRDWGVIVEARLNHELARTHWASGSPAGSRIDPDTEGINYEDMILTIAAKMDQRLCCYADHPAQRRDASKKVIHARGARLQFLTQGTVLGAVGGTLRTSPASGGLVLRNDNERLHVIMAGAKQRYLEDRFAVVIVWNELRTYLSKLGDMLVMGSAEGDLADKWALVTSVEWDFAQGRTILRAGYAR